MSAAPHASAASRARVDAAFARLEGWVAERLRLAGYPEIEVVDDRVSGPAERPRIALVPYRLIPWPRRVELAQDVALLRVSDRQAGVPEPWRELARLLSEALADFAEVSPRGVIPPVVESMAPALAAWYRAAGPDWVLTGQDFTRARPPALMWRSSHTMRAQVLAFAEVPAGRPERPVSLLAALAEAATADRALDVELPGPAPTPELVSLVEALCLGLPEALSEGLSAALAQVQRPARWSLTLVPYPDLEAEDIGQLCRALGRPLRAAVPLVIQIPLGGGPVLTPASASASFTSQTLR